MAFCPKAGAEGPQAAEIKNDFPGTVGMCHPMDGYRLHRLWLPVSMATARLQEIKGVVEALERGKRGATPSSGGNLASPPTPHPPPRHSLGLGLPRSFVTGCVSLIPL